MAKLTIGRMANLYGLHRSTLHEAVAKGRVTVEFDGKGQKTIDLSEMIRVYGEPPGKPRHSPTPEADTLPTLPAGALQALLEELRLLREEVRELRETMRLIEHKPNPQPAPEQPHEEAQPELATWAGLLKSLD